MDYKVTFIPGDGVGFELAEATRRVLEATGVRFQWENVVIGSDAYDKFGSVLPDSALDSIRKNKVAIKGPVTTPIGSGFRSVNVGLRKKLDLYACLRPCKSYKGIETPYQGVDIVVVRENTEDLYAGIEVDIGTKEADSLREFIAGTTGDIIREDSAISLKTISITATRRIVQFAFDYARDNNRRKVTAIHKSNILRIKPWAVNDLPVPVGRRNIFLPQYNDFVIDLV